MRGAQLPICYPLAEANMSKHELISPMLDQREFATLIGELPGIFRDLLGDDAIVVCQYGALSKLHPTLWHVPMDVGLKWLDRFLRESVEQRIFEPGDTDLHIATREGTLEIGLCHEGDIHLSGTDPDLVRRLAEHPVISPLFGERSSRA